MYNSSLISVHDGMTASTASSKYQYAVRVAAGYRATMMAAKSLRRKAAKSSTTTTTHHPRPHAARRSSESATDRSESVVAQAPRGPSGRQSPKCLAAPARTYVWTSARLFAFSRSGDWDSRPGTGMKKAWADRAGMARNDGAFLRGKARRGWMCQALRIAMMGQRTRISPCPGAWTHVQVHVREGDEASRSLPLAPALHHKGGFFLCLEWKRALLHASRPSRRPDRHLYSVGGGGPAAPR